MTPEEMLKSLILSRYKSIRDFVQHTTLSYSTVDSILRRGIANSSLSNILKLCNVLGISADGLADNKIIPVTPQQEPQTTDIETTIALIRNNLIETAAAIDGEPMTQAEIETFIDAIEIAIGLIKRKRNKAKGE